MRRLSFVWVCVAVLAGCTAAVEMPDLALVPPGCRLPAKCYKSSCSCKRASLDDDCLVCDPTLMTGQQCDCFASEGNVCEETGQLCVGKGPLCPGVGARCLDPRNLDGGTTPPSLVAVDTGDAGIPASEPRCTFTDDVCVPGSDDGGADLSVPDLGAPPDLLGTTD